MTFELRPARRLDWGRVGAVPLFAVLLLVNANSMWQRADEAAGYGPVVYATSTLTSCLAILFFAAILAAYLRRGPASRTTASIAAKLAGVTATFLPVALPIVSGGDSTATHDLLSGVLILAGFGFSLWSVATLGRNLSIFAQARGLVTTGPYRWVRHPLYLAELFAVLGLCLREATWRAAVLWLVLAVLQVFRAHQEEQLLGEVVAGYEQYRLRSARVIPGIY